MSDHSIKRALPASEEREALSHLGSVPLFVPESGLHEGEASFCSILFYSTLRRQVRESRVASSPWQDPRAYVGWEWGLERALYQITYFLVHVKMSGVSTETCITLMGLHHLHRALGSGFVASQC